MKRFYETIFIRMFLLRKYQQIAMQFKLNPIKSGNVVDPVVEYTFV